MAKSLIGQLAVLLLFLLPLIFAATGAPDSFAEELASTTNWRESVGLGKEKVTKLQFYLHDIVTGDNPSAVLIADAATSGASPTMFGKTSMIDDWLTVGPEPDSEEIGWAQGMYGFASQREGTLDLLRAVNYYFTYGNSSKSGSGPTVSLSSIITIALKNEERRLHVR